MRGVFVTFGLLYARDELILFLSLPVLRRDFLVPALRQADRRPARFFVRGTEKSKSSRIRAEGKLAQAWSFEGTSTARVLRSQLRFNAVVGDRVVEFWIDR